MAKEFKITNRSKMSDEELRVALQMYAVLKGWDIDVLLVGPDPWKPPVSGSERKVPQSTNLAHLDLSGNLRACISRSSSTGGCSSPVTFGDLEKLTLRACGVKHKNKKHKKELVSKMAAYGYYLADVSRPAREFVDKESPVGDLGLGQRALNCLIRAQIFTVEDLCKKKLSDLRGITNFGDQSMEETLAALQHYGYSLRSPVFSSDMEEGSSVDHG